MRGRAVGRHHRGATLNAFATFEGDGVGADCLDHLIQLNAAIRQVSGQLFGDFTHTPSRNGGTALAEELEGKLEHAAGGAQLVL